MKIIDYLAAALLSGLFLTQTLAQDRWPAKNLIQPQSLAARLAETDRPAPLLLFVGFPVLYRGIHITGAILAGPGSKTEGLETLRKAVHELPRNREIVLYCGCCPFVKCPNVKPAYTALREMGFSRLKVIYLEANFHTNWVAKGYPVAKGL